MWFKNNAVFDQNKVILLKTKKIFWSAVKLFLPKPLDPQLEKILDPDPQLIIADPKPCLGSSTGTRSGSVRIFSIYDVADNLAKPSDFLSSS
jgi:hypothetical protein